VCVRVFCATTRAHGTPRSAAARWMQTSGNVVQSEWVNRIIIIYNIIQWRAHTHTHVLRVYIHVKFEAIRINDSPRPTVVRYIGTRDTSLKRHQSVAGAWWTPLYYTAAAIAPRIMRALGDLCGGCGVLPHAVVQRKRAYFRLAQPPRVYIPTYYLLYNSGKRVRIKYIVNNILCTHALYLLLLYTYPSGGVCTARARHGAIIYERGEKYE